jgi:hypothetical protein
LWPPAGTTGAVEVSSGPGRKVLVCD